MAMASRIVRCRQHFVGFLDGVILHCCFGPDWRTVTRSTQKSVLGGPGSFAPLCLQVVWEIITPEQKKTARRESEIVDDGAAAGAGAVKASTLNA